jgi:hypothetical protein
VTKHNKLGRGLSAASIASCGALLLGGCGGSSSNPQAPAVNSVVLGGENQYTVYGSSVAEGSGQVRAFLTRAGNVPTALGLEFTPAITSGQPVLQYGQGTIIHVPVPAGLNITPFKDITIDYSPGHTPNGNQTVPHFHPTFLMYDAATAATVAPGAPGETTAINPDEIPNGHIPAGMTIPGEGYIYFDAALIPYNAQPFVSTEYQYDFWNGHMNMIQLGAAATFIQTKADDSDILLQPHTYPTAGYYPTHYQYHWDATRQVATMYMDKWTYSNGTSSAAVGHLPALSVPSNATITYGGEMVVGNGLARTYLITTGGTVSTVGVEYNAGVLSGMPQVAKERAQDFNLPTPAGLENTVFKSISMMWTPGHIPPNQETPHFQANFFLLTYAERIQQVGLAAQFVPVAPAEVPAGLIDFGNVVPFEGTPFIDVTNPQWSEQPLFLTAGYNYDFANGHMDNIQLGMTNSFVQSQASTLGPLAQPQTFPAPGSYPTYYHFNYDTLRGVYTAYVDTFVAH